MKKNILFLIESLRDGGSERSISSVATEIAKKHNVLLVVADKKEKDYDFSGKIVEIKEFISKNPFKRLFGIRKLKMIKKKYNIDISISYLTAYNLYNVLSRYKDKVFISIRNHLSTKKEGIIARNGTIYSNKKADKIICCSKSVEIDQIDNFKADINKTIVIENYVNEINFKKYKLNNIVVTVGRLTRHKGQEHIIKAMSLVIKKVPDAKLLILGRGPSNDYLVELINNFKLTNNVELSGYTIDLDKFLSMAKLFVLASDYEGFSNSLLEAMSYSIPVIATNSPGGNSEILSDHYYKTEINKSVHSKYGILIPVFINEHNTYKITKNERILAKEIVNLLINKQDYNYYKIKSNERAKYYNKSMIIKKWFNIIEEE